MLAKAHKDGREIYSPPHYSMLLHWSNKDGKLYIVSHFSKVRHMATNPQREISSGLKHHCITIHNDYSYYGIIQHTHTFLNINNLTIMTV